MIKLLIVFLAIGVSTALGGGPPAPQDGVQFGSSQGLTAIQQPDGSIQVVPTSLVDEAIETLGNSVVGRQSVSTVLHDPTTGLDFPITTDRGENETLKHWKNRHMEAVLFWMNEFADEALKKGITERR